MGRTRLLFLILTFFSCREQKEVIDRYALVNRHNVVLHQADTLGSLSVGNGEFAFTVDVSGLQTFPGDYENGISLGTQAQWAWHSIPQGEHYTIDDIAQAYESCDGTQALYPVQHRDGRKGNATAALRSNPHRLHLGLVGLVLLKENGEEAKLADLRNIHQQLDLWTGKIESTYEIEGKPVKVILYAHQEEDGIAARIESPLLKIDRLKIKLSFHYGADCHVCPAYDRNHPEKHQSIVFPSVDNNVVIKRVLDSTIYYTHITHNTATLKANSNSHQFELTPEKHSESFEFTVLFNRDSSPASSDFKTVEENSITRWKKFWRSGGAIDFSACTDPRAKELERRVVLSQYLTKIQCAGSMPPQETGLTMNSWYGKSHLEMHWWHAAHFAFWNRPELLEKSMGWYETVLAKAQATAKWQGYEGARWQKMTDPYGNESPSSVGAFIVWQQPHPIYFAELLYRHEPKKETLEKYRSLVFSTADFMASFVKRIDGKYHLCHPLIPAQEIFKATETDDPAYELQYWYYGLAIAQVWRKRLGMVEEEYWATILENLSPLAIKDNLYLPTATSPEAYTDSFYRRDHPSVVGALGFLPLNHRVDTLIMNNTFQEIMREWQWPTTWGWDYPLLAMTAARLNKPEQAIDALLMDVQKNTYLINGHNYQDKRLRLYLPGNGGLLAAVAMMTSGWDGNNKDNPGFPKDGKWNVKWEGLTRVP